MKNVLVTGAAGFVGRNLVAALQRRNDVSIITYDVDDKHTVLGKALLSSDVVYHIAGVNRPDKTAEFDVGNASLTKDILAFLQKNGKSPTVVFSSSIHAEQDNPYGRSKKRAEEFLLDYQHTTGAPVCIYRLPNLFGKWSRPNYNTVVATFCHNIVRNLEISISDPNHELELAYIDDVVANFIRHIHDKKPEQQHYYIDRTFRVTLKDLAEKIREIHDIRNSLVVPDLSDPFMVCLYATYLSFLPKDAFAATAEMKKDERGWLFELIKSEKSGQIFVSKTLPGVTRGDHYHDTKAEKFCVIQGNGIIRFRMVDSDKIIEYPVNDQEICIVDIPPGNTHSIENTGDKDMICLFWANQIFNPEQPDTHFDPVIKELE